MSLKLEDFYVSETLGFVLESPLEKLPSYFEPWNHLAKEMSHLVADNKMRQEVDQMLLLDHNLLEGYRQKRLAHFQLTVITAGYVWQYGDSGASKSIPACIAIPLFQLSRDLGLQPVIGHPGLALANWAPINPERALSLENIRCLYKLPGGVEAEWFCTVTTMVELTFAQCLKSILSALNGVDAGTESQVADSLSEITRTVNEMKAVLSRMHDKLSADTFFNILRPFLGGWGGEGNPLPAGLLYKGVSPEPIQALGGSAAQSTTLQALDALLGVEHKEDKKDFLIKMRHYMPPAHRQFVEAIENQPKSLRKFVCSSNDCQLHQAYNACLSAVIDFRTYHIQIVTKYVVTASTKQRSDKRFESLDKKGTGGTSLLPFLKDLRQDTHNQLVNESLLSESVDN